MLDFLSEREILNEFELGKDEYSWTDKKFTDVYIYDGLKTYEYLSVMVKRKNDKKYIIHSVRGMIDYKNIDDCLQKQKTNLSRFKLNVKLLKKI